MRSLKIISRTVIFVLFLVVLFISSFFGLIEANTTLPQQPANSPEAVSNTVSEKAQSQAEAFYLVGARSEREGNHNAAESAYQSALKISRENRLTTLEGSSLHRLAVLKAKENKVGESEQFFKQAKPFCENNVVFLYDYAKLYMDQKRFSNAETILKAAALLAPNDRRVLYNLGYAIAMQKDRQTEGLRYLKLALGEKRAYEELSRIYRFQGNEGQAEFARQRGEQLEVDQTLPEISQDVQDRICKELSFHEGKMMISELNKAAAMKEEVAQTVKILPEETIAQQNSKSPKALPGEEAKTEAAPIRPLAPIGSDPFLIAVQATSKEQVVSQNKEIKTFSINEQNIDPNQKIQGVNANVRSLPGGHDSESRQIVQNKPGLQPNFQANLTPPITAPPNERRVVDNNIRNENLQQTQQNLLAQNQTAFVSNGSDQTSVLRQENTLRQNPVSTAGANAQPAFKPKNETVSVLQQPQVYRQEENVISPSVQFAKSVPEQRAKVNLVPPNNSVAIASNFQEQNGGTFYQSEDTGSVAIQNPISVQQFPAAPYHELIETEQSSKRKLEFISRSSEPVLVDESNSLPVLAFRTNGDPSRRQPMFESQSGPSFETRKMNVARQSESISSDRLTESRISNPSNPSPYFEPNLAQEQEIKQKEIVATTESRRAPSPASIPMHRLPSYQEENRKEEIVRQTPSLQNPIIEESKPVLSPLPVEEKLVQAVPLEQVKPTPKPMSIASTKDGLSQQKEIEVAAKPIFTTPDEKTIRNEKTSHEEEIASGVHWAEPNIVLTPTISVPIGPSTSTSAERIVSETKTVQTPVAGHPVPVVKTRQFASAKTDLATTDQVSVRNSVEVAKQTVPPSLPELSVSQDSHEKQIQSLPSQTEVAAQPIKATPMPSLTASSTPFPPIQAAKPQPIESHATKFDMVKSEEKIPSIPKDQISQNEKELAMRSAKASSVTLESNRTTSPSKPQTPAPQKTYSPSQENQENQTNFVSQPIRTESKQFTSEQQRVEFVPKDQIAKKDVEKNQGLEHTERKEAKNSTDSFASSGILSSPNQVSAIRNEPLPQTSFQPNRAGVFVNDGTPKLSTETKSEFASNKQEALTEQRGKVDRLPKTEQQASSKPKPDIPATNAVQKEIYAAKPNQNNLPVFIPPFEQSVKQHQTHSVAAQPNPADLADKLEVLQQQQPQTSGIVPNESLVAARKPTPNQNIVPKMFSDAKFDQTLELLEQNNAQPVASVPMRPASTGFASTQQGGVSAMEWEELRLKAYSMPTKTPETTYVAVAPESTRVAVKENAVPRQAEVKVQTTVKSAPQNAGFARSGTYVDPAQKQTVEHQPLINWDKVRNLGEQKRRW